MRQGTSFLCRSRVRKPPACTTSVLVTQKGNCPAHNRQGSPLLRVLRCTYAAPRSHAGR
jgi:hypothetical protein